MPSKVFVRDLSKSGICKDDQVALFHTSSGTGKTVELASSAATRGADFTFVLQFSYDIDGHFKSIDPNDRNQKAERNKTALDMILHEIGEVLKGNEPS